MAGGIAAFLKNALALGFPQMRKDTNGATDLIDPSTGLPFPLAIVNAFSSTPQVYASPIAGDPDLTYQVPICSYFHMGTGFMMPKAGLLTEIGFFAQGSSGDGASKTLRYNVVSLGRDVTAATGLKVDANLLTGTVPLANNFNGKVVVATGLELAVPAQFMVFLKTSASAASLGTYAQACMSAGPIPGVVGDAYGSLVSASVYTPETMDFIAGAPRALAVGEKIVTDAYKGIACYIKWKGL